MWDRHIAKIDTSDNRINLVGPTRPGQAVPYRAVQIICQFEKQEIDRMVEADVIDPSNTEQASPIFMTCQIGRNSLSWRQVVAKKFGSLRFCVEYRKFNEMTNKDPYTIPHMDENIDSLRDAVIFTILDSN